MFKLSTSIVVDAPRDVVWKVLMDWKSYHEWNPFVRDQRITDASKRPLEHQPRAGDHLYIYPVHIPPSFEPPRVFPAGSSLQLITVLDTSNYRCAWRTTGMPRWLLASERWQRLVEVEDGRTRYETEEVFEGVLAYVIKVLLGEGLGEGFEAMAEGLKRRSEEEGEAVSHAG